MTGKKKIISRIAITVAVLLVVAGIVAGSCAIYEAELEKQYSFIEYDGSKGGDRIHFLNVGSSDAILLESDGRFALIDSGEDTDNPRGFEGLELEGYEDFVVDYLNAFCADENGEIYLDFVLGTHAHSDHIGGFDTVIMQDNVHIGKAYLKRYYEDRIKKKEVETWDNLEVYTQMVEALQTKGVELVQDLTGVSFEFGNFTITIFNGEEPSADDKVGENENSLAVLVEKDGYRVMLSGDLNNFDGDEKRVAPQVGKVDVLKLGHHGYLGSSSYAYINELQPEIAIQTNNKPANISVRLNVTIINGAPIYSTGDHNGIILDVTDVADVKLYEDIVKE